MSRTTRLLAGAVLVAVAIGAYWMLLLSPKRDERDSLTTQIAAAQTAADSAMSTLAAYRKAQGAYVGNYTTVTKLGKAVPADDDVRSLVVQLQAAAAAGQVDFQSIEATGGGTTSGAAAAQTDAPPPGSQLVGTAG